LQRQVFQANLWGRIRPVHRSSITAEEFEAAVNVFAPGPCSSACNMADLIESIMLDETGKCLCHKSAAWFADLKPA